MYFNDNSRVFQLKKSFVHTWTKPMKEEVIIEDIKEKRRRSQRRTKEKEPKEEAVTGQKKPPVVPSIVNKDNETVTTKLSFNDYDSAQDPHWSH